MCDNILKTNHAEINTLRVRKGMTPNNKRKNIAEVYQSWNWDGQSQIINK